MPVPPLLRPRKMKDLDWERSKKRILEHDAEHSSRPRVVVQIAAMQMTSFTATQEDVVARTPIQ